MQKLTHNWKFMMGEIENAQAVDFDDLSWREVSVPHDYAIEGPFSPENDVHKQSVFQDDIHNAIVHVGRTGGLPIDKSAWYRREFEVAANAKNVFLEFDGVMSNSVIYVNGIECAEQKYGYTSFSVDISDVCIKGGKNTVAISLSPKGVSSRWYTGAGIYREVRLVEKNEMYFPYHAGFVLPEVKNNVAYIECNMEVCANEAYEIEYTIKNREGDVVAHTINSNNEVQLFKLNGFVKWNIYDSYLYTMEAKLLKNGELMDEYSTKFGIRTIEFNAQKGFIINGKRMKLNGVCIHHDLGALGAAFNKAAARRQIEKLIEVGVNSIRTSHNPPAPEYLDLCDEYGIVVLDEAFDEWKEPKVANGYGNHFEETAEKDLVALIKRDRNHPCVIMWSIGNEIHEERIRNGWTFAKFLSDICKREDSSRPVTAGVPSPWEAFKNGFCDFLDVVGINYRPQMYEKLHNEYPNVPLYASETCSCVSSRDEYHATNVLPNIVLKTEDFQINSNDFEATPNGYYPEREFFFQDKNEFMCGEYVWTGFDYIGEPSPYRLEWPSRSSYFGFFDLAGLPKDRAYSYQTKWTDKEVLHLFPHWNWEKGDKVDVQCYSSFDEVELFVNGVSVGISVKNEANDILKYRHVWKNVAYEAGEIKAVAVRKPSVFEVIKTAGEVAKISLSAEKTEITADGDDLVYVVCTALDKDGNLCNTANTKLDFAVEGAGKYIAADGGDATSLRVFAENYCELYNGKCVAIIRSKEGETGEIKLTVSSTFGNENCIIKAI